MSTSNRPFLGVFVGVLLVVMLGGVGLAWSVHRAGMLEIDVCSDDVDLRGFRVPAAFANAALWFVPSSVFNCADMEFELWGDLVAEACDELRRCPDFTMVHITSDHEYVQVRKEGDALVVDVEDDQDAVHVSVPLSTAKAFIKKVKASQDWDRS